MSKSNTAPTSGAPADEPDTDPIETAAPGGESDAGDLLEELRGFGNADIVISRAPSAGRPGGAFVDRVAAASFDYPGLLAYIQQRHGGGEYRLQPRRGGRYLKGATVVSIEAPREVEPAAPPAPRAPLAEPPSPPRSGFEPPEWLKPLVMPIALKLADKLLDKPAPAPAAPAAGFTFDNAMALMALLFKQRGPEPVDPIDNITRLLALQRELRSEVEPRDEGAEMLKMLAGVLPALASGAGAGASTPRPRAPVAVVGRADVPRPALAPQPASAPPAAPTVAGAPPPEPSPASGDRSQMTSASPEDQVRQLLALLVRLAQRDADLSTVLSVLHGLLSVEEFDSVESMLRGQGAQLPQLADLFPDLRPHRAWLTRLGEQASALFGPDDAGAAVESGPVSDSEPQP